MDRRAFITGTLSLLAAPLAAEAQHAGKVPRIGILAADSGGPVWDGFRQGLRDLGYVEGQTIVVEWRYIEGKLERVPALATELVKLRVDVLITSGAQAIHLVRRVTKTVPIVAAGAGDLVASGLATSVAKPGGNVTGVQVLQWDLAGKRLELLKETVPNLSRVGVLSELLPPDNPILANSLREIRSASRALGVQVHAIGVRNAGEFSGAFAELSRERAGALIVSSNPFIYFHRKQIADLAAKNRLPAMFEARVYVDAGGLVSYGPNGFDVGRRAASHVDKILKGAKPADIPIEQPTKFELVINPKTAKALGLTIPRSLLLRADEVIQ